MATRFMALFALTIFCWIPCMAKKIKGNGNIITKAISINEYTAITMGSGVLGYSDSWFSILSRGGSSNSYVFNYKQGISASLQITIDENLYPYLDIKVINEELSITTKKGEELVPTSMNISGTSKNLKKIHMSGSMDFVLQSALAGYELDVLTTKGSDITMKHPIQMRHCTVIAREGGDIIFDNLACETINCKASSGSDIKLKGKAAEAQFGASGGSDIKGSDFIVNRMECSASGGSDIYTHATDYIKASASGGSDIRYRGNPKANTSASGGSDIIKEDH